MNGPELPRISHLIVLQNLPGTVRGALIHRQYLIFFYGLGHKRIQTLFHFSVIRHIIDGNYD